MVYTKIQVVFDAAEPEKLAEFWGLALGYVPEPPPPGFATWEEFARSREIDPSEFGDVASRVDPAGEGPRLYFQKVPEGKTAKNRVHLDVRVAGRELRGPERDKLVAEMVARLEAAGGTVAWVTDDKRGKATVMRDPEGNEFCVA
ncbi:MAG: VOC family protein [Trebonia sp.]